MEQSQQAVAPTEELSQQPIAATYDPLDEVVNEKAYGNRANSFSPEDLGKDIGEPSFTPPPVMDDNPFFEPQADQPKKKKDDKPFNPAMNEMPDSERTKAGEKMADMLLAGYGKAHDLANEMLKVPKRKIAKMQMKGEIDLSVGVPYNMNNEFVELGDFIKEYNAQAGQVLVLEKEFVDDVKPPLARVLAKRGYGLTDEQLLLYMFGQDVLYKGAQFWQMKQQTADILKFAREQSAEGRNRRTQPTPMPMPQQAPDTPPQMQTAAPEPMAAKEYQEINDAGTVSIQDHILQQHGRDGAMSAGGTLPEFGGAGKLKKMEDFKKQESVQHGKKATKVKTVSDIPDGKRGRGRPKGVKNKKNKLGL